MDLEFVTRGMVDGDRGYLFSSYLKSLRRYSEKAKQVLPALYYPRQHEMLEFLLGAASVTVACYPEAPSEILGYAIHQEMPSADVLHYLYTRRKSNGVRSGLVASVASRAPMVVVTHMMRDFRWLVQKVDPRPVVYDPQLLDKLRAA